MQFEKFQEKYAAAFGSKLTERNGLTEWADWIEDDQRSDGLIVKVLREFADEYNSAIAAMSPNAKSFVPTLEGFKARYFAIIRESRQATGERSDCRTCGGRGIVFALAPCKGDGNRQLAPEDWRDVSLARVYPFAEAYNCPACRATAKMYEGKEFFRQRVEAHCLPEIVAADDPRNPYGGAIGGDLLIRWRLADRFAAEAAKQPTLEEAFPI